MIKASLRVPFRTQTYSNRDSLQTGRENVLVRLGVGKLIESWILPRCRLCGRLGEGLFFEQQCGFLFEANPGSYVRDNSLQEMYGPSEDPRVLT